MTSHPLVSIITPVLDREKYISLCIKSILNQTYKNFEYIIIDDCSTDNTSKIINEYSQLDKRIIVIKNSNNLGASKSYNLGVEISKGKYLMRLDSDDIAYPDRIEKQVNYLNKNKKIFAIGTGAELIDENGKKFRIKRFPKDFNDIKKIFNYTNGLFNSSVMMNLELINYEKKDIYLNPLIYPADDFYMWKKIISNNLVIENIDDILHKHRVHPGSESLKNSIEQGYKTLLSVKIFSSNSNKLDIKNYIHGKEVLFDKLPKDLRPSPLEITFFSNSYQNYKNIRENFRYIFIAFSQIKLNSKDFYFIYLIISKLILKIFSIMKRRFIGKS